MPTFPDNLLVPSARVKKTFLPLKMGSISRPETSERKYPSTLRNIPEERRSREYDILKLITCFTVKNRTALVSGISLDK